MNWSLALMPSVPSIVAMAVGILAFFGARYARRREKADAASIITATAMSLLAPLNIEVAKLQGSVLALTDQVGRLRGKVTTLETDNRKLRIENSGLRDRVAVLELQIVGLGHTPANGHPAGTVTTSTTEVVTVTEGPTP